MKINWFYIRMLVLVAVTLGLVAFTHKRNTNRKVKEVKVFVDSTNID